MEILTPNIIPKEMLLESIQYRITKLEKDIKDGYSYFWFSIFIYLIAGLYGIFFNCLEIFGSAIFLGIWGTLMFLYGLRKTKKELNKARAEWLLLRLD